MCWFRFLSTKKGESAQLCDKEPQLGTQSALFSILSKYGISSQQEGDKTDSSGNRWVMCVEKNKTLLPGVTIRLGSGPRMCQESQILSVWEEVT